MAQAIQQQESSLAILQRTARVAGVLTVCVLVLAGLYLFTLYMIMG
jgi:hypothetical protein